MEFTHENVVAFMENYFKDFAEYGQNTETAHRMDDYLVPDLEFIPYIAGNAPISGRDQFLRLMSAHPSSLERLVPEDIMVDVRRQVAVVLLKTEIIDKKTGEVLVTKMYHPLYQLRLDENDTIKIQKILFFEEILPLGTLDVGDVLKKDAGMKGLFL
jgi:hypothetical protein